MTNYKSIALNALIFSASAYLSTEAFVNTPSSSFGVSRHTQVYSTATENEVDARTGKRTGNSFLSDETKERGAKGNPIEKMKQAKDATSAFVDVYEYAAKIRAGEMTWQDVEKADLDNVSLIVS
mmetsp:Transcript_21251/g.24149  ORF Transcript_21251/g.24149 Transcript_21251/m.24149 type:complete len:124 (-) Transcript_21251:1694-2065(-)